MNVTVNVVPPTERHVELSVSGLKNFQAVGDGFIAQLTVNDLRTLWDTITAKLKEAGIPVTTEPIP